MKRILFLIITFCLYFSNSGILYAGNNPVRNEDSVIPEQTYNQSQLLLEYFVIHSEDINIEKYSNGIAKYKDTKKESASYKSPWVAVILSYLFPGAGQLYNGEYLKAILFPTACCIGLGVLLLSNPGADFSATKGQETVGIIGISIALGSYIWNLIDAPVSSNRLNKENNLSRLKIYPINNEKYVLNLNPGNSILQFSISF